MKRRALTLLEVMASAVLLTLLAATCVPLLQQAMRGLREPTPSVGYLELARFADAFVVDASGLGVDVGAEQGGVEIPWPDEPERPVVLVERLTAEDEEVDHAWFTFTCEGYTVSRWVEIDREEEEKLMP